MTEPFLTICVPSRNRQRYFQETIGFLVENARDDVEFVFADNSDDASVMNAFMAGISDTRVKCLPSPPQTLSMIDNWERCLEAATGRWVSVVGDDDLIDPDLIDALKIAAALKPGLEGFGWSNLKYDWATADAPVRNVQLPLECTFHDMPQPLLFRRAFRWDDAGVTLTCGYSVYHAAISRDLLERVKARFGGRFFEHPTLDYESAMKNIALGRNFVYCRRPFSIYGTCPESNTSAAWNPKLIVEAIARTKGEFGHDYEGDPWMRGFPFDALLGMPSSVVQAQQFLRFTYGIGLAGWEANFARSAAAYCGKFSDRDDFEAMSERFRAAFKAYKGGAFVKDFEPVFTPKREGKVFTGLLGNDLYIEDRIGGATSPATFYRAVNGLLTRPGELAPELRTASKDSTVIASLAA
jgi:glycosyltransferase involved in cell wall biosynthesis